MNGGIDTLSPHDGIYHSNTVRAVSSTGINGRSARCRRVLRVRPSSRRRTATAQVARTVGRPRRSGRPEQARPVCFAVRGLPVRRFAVRRFAVCRFAVRRFAVHRFAVRRFAVRRFAVRHFVRRFPVRVRTVRTTAVRRSASSVRRRPAVYRLPVRGQDVRFAVHLLPMRTRAHAVHIDMCTNCTIMLNHYS